MPADRQIVALLGIAAEVSFFSAILGASLILKRAGVEPAEAEWRNPFALCMSALIAIIILHSAFGLAAQIARRAFWKSVAPFFWCAWAYMAAMAVIALLY